jgi:DNA-directed RNA polymerase subunit RPC12/RpoP
MSDNEKPSDHPGDIGFDDTPMCYKCSVCGEEYLHRPSLQWGEVLACGECYEKLISA